MAWSVFCLVLLQLKPYSFNGSTIRNKTLESELVNCIKLLISLREDVVFIHSPVSVSQLPTDLLISEPSYVAVL